MDDWQCLREFVEAGSQSAFARLVSAHVDLVYSAALRQVKDRHMAEDVTQSAFIVLARKARSLRRGASLAAWLLVTTRYLALDALDARARRERHEREAAAMPKTETPPIDPAQWDAISPQLDGALASLSGKDREAITLRYFQGKSFAEVADAMGLSVEAARQRVHRATLRMRAFFADHGVPVAPEVIGPVILAHAVHPAPAGLANSATAAAAAARAAGAALTGKGTVLLMAMTKAKIAIGTAALVLACGGAVITYKAASPSSDTVIIRSDSQSGSVSEPSGDWQARMNEVYGLAEGQDVKQVSAPPLVERELYWEKVNRGQKLQANPVVTFEWDGSKLQWQTFGDGPGTLFDFLTLCAHLHTWEIDSSVPSGLKFPGDWVTRKGAAITSLMEGLRPIVSAKLGRAVRFELRHVVREAIVARGTYHYVPLHVPLHVPLPGRKDDGVIEMRGEKPAAFLPPARRESLRQFLEGLDSYTYQKVFVEVDSPAQQVKVRAGAWGGEAEAKVIMNNFAAQTSLHFDHEPREMDVWFMTDARPSDSRSPLP